MGIPRGHYADEPAIAEYVVLTVLTKPSTDVSNPTTVAGVVHEMKKLLAVAIMILFIGMSIIPSISASLDDDIEITISAGVLRKS